MMKKMLFLFGLLLPATVMLASTGRETAGYHPFLKEGKVWNCQVTEHFSEIVDGNLQSGYRTVAFSLVLSGDSIVGGRTYQKMYRQDDEGHSVLFEDALWREEDRKVYVYRNGEESLRYDFSLTPTQNVSISGVNTTLLAVDTVMAGERPFRRFYVGLDEDNSWERVWVEGVGHPDGPFRV